MGTWVCCPQCDAVIAISGRAQRLTCSSCDTDLHYDGAGKCRTLFRRTESLAGTASAQDDPAPSR